ncbi:amidohydrolase family protein [Aspergillus novofumigatus IBT 16806]|uniref:6-methylsalicylate decarboxylase n=1 Tax=Aspergillus novofumigatus (strain IBT 16806) TaxID=1392255 RepID=A0A2I1CJC5_ASPN1|nr:amidohydrolase family protein [Aspergillus novofumigatus IBT 16806]PKX97728.1 amidohydrolase family protein [Aspergillus novofumigatus IBT 16806]
MGKGTIDVHHHLIPPRFRELWFANIEKARGLQLPTWSAEGTLEALDECGISTAVISMGHPVHPYVDDIQQVAPICREINEYTANVRDAHPDRIGFFATLPPMDQTDACIEEMRYSLDQLQADGLVIFSSYAGRYLGHPTFRPVWEEFNQRGAAVLIHPGFEGMAPIEEPRILAPPIIDWTHETTRTAVHLITNNIIRDFPNVKIILSHAGGTLPYVVQRAANLCCRLRVVDKTEEEFIEEARVFYIDVAFSGHEPQLRLLKEFAKPGHVLFGSDYPWEKADVMSEQLKATDNIFAEETREAALKLFPRLAKYEN